MNNAVDRADRFIFNGIDDPNNIFEYESNLKLPRIDEGEVLVKVLASTICLSDIHTVTGARIEPTPRYFTLIYFKLNIKYQLKCKHNCSVLGHEAVVEIVDHKRGDETDFKIGDRVTFSIADSCGQCEFCLNNLSQKCKALFKVNLLISFFKNKIVFLLRFNTFEVWPL
jgi:threonine dehydrogenase-like Zn-dependent dehydrogenase